jgi:uncharacterized protein YbcI
MAPPEHERGNVKVALSNAIVGLLHDYTGRGPTRARAYYDGDLVVVMCRDTMTTAEAQLAQSGEGEFVLRLRRKVQATMSEDAVEAVEAITGRQVIAFMSDNHLEPDVAAEVFLLAREEGDGGPSAREGDGHASAEE